MKELTRSSRLIKLETPAITISNLCFAYTENKNTLTDINIQIALGESVGLIGANGAGKTTLFLTSCGI